MTPAPPPLTASQLSALRRIADEDGEVLTYAGPVPLAAVLAWGDAAMAVRDRLLADASTNAETREDALEQAAQVADADDGLVPVGRPFGGLAQYGPLVAERIATAIRALKEPT